MNRSRLAKIRGNASISKAGKVDRSTLKPFVKHVWKKMNGALMNKPESKIERLAGKVMDDIIRRIVKVAQPEKIILFGSSARGTASADSDIDVLVVKRCVQRRDIAGKIYQELIGVGRAVDVVVVTPEDIERFRDSPGTVICPAIKEGRVIYAI